MTVSVGDVLRCAALFLTGMAWIVGATVMLGVVLEILMILYLPRRSRPPRKELSVPPRGFPHARQVRR